MLLIGVLVASNTSQPWVETRIAVVNSPKEVERQDSVLWNGVTVRHVLLTVAALAVLGLGIYLFLAVRAGPATADVPAPRPHVVTHDPDGDGDDAPMPAPRDAAPRPVVRDAAMASGNPSTNSTNPPPALAADATNGTDLQKADALMSEATKAYDRGDYDDSKSYAAKVLATDPTNIRMLRIMVSASCIDGDSIEAQKHFLLLPTPDREQMKIRCSRYGVSFNDK